MRIEYPHPQRVHYLTVQGKYVTPNASVVAPGAGTGPITSTKVCDWVSTPNHRELALNFTVEAMEGLDPTLDIYLDVLDPIEPQNSNASPAENAPLVSLKLDATQVTTEPVNIRVIVASGAATAWQGNTPATLGAFNVPMRWQVRFVVGGEVPSYDVVATYEARE